MITQPAPGRIHLVGSIGLDSVESVFRTVGELIGPYVQRIPDGEVGGRRLWVSWQYPLLRSSPYLRPDPGGTVRKTTKFPLLCLADPTAADEIAFGELGYAREARASYLDFVAARERGELPAGARFQVCLPTPMGVIYAFCIAPDLSRIELAYEKAMLDEVRALCQSIPHSDLCIQWDICHEIVMLADRQQDQFPMIAASREEIVARLKRLSEAVPSDVELGYHLCYGDFGAQHYVEPPDASLLVDLSNRLVTEVHRPITYIHMPVPLSRDDDAYFKPLAALKLDDRTELYFGLIHAADGVEGVKRRALAARRYVPYFGLATECGLARARKPAFIRGVLALHREAIEELG